MRTPRSINGVMLKYMLLLALLLVLIVEISCYFIVLRRFKTAWIRAITSLGENGFVT